MMTRLIAALHRHAFAFGSLLLLATASLLTLANTSLYGLTGLLWAGVIGLVGYLALVQFNGVAHASRLERLLLSGGMGILVLTLVGLAINTIGLVLDVATLRSGWALAATMLVAVTLLYAAHVRGRIPRAVPAVLSADRRRRTLWLLAPWLLPLASIVGAIQLNNGGPNTIAFGVLTAIAIVATVLGVRRESPHKAIYVSVIAAASLALVLGVSMRSNHLMGFDIHGEFSALTTTLNNGIWTPDQDANAYSSCLSITVLPAMFVALTHVSPDYVFKFFMQLIICLLPLAVYAIARRAYAMDAKQSFIAALLFLAPGQFIFQFPSLLRQQPALLFFALILIVSIIPRMPRTTKSALMMLFGFGMITAHYSTSYVCIALLFLFWLATKLYSLHEQGRRAVRYHLPVTLVAVLFVGTFLWYGQFVQNTGGVASKISASFSNLQDTFDAESRSPFITNTLGLGSVSYSSQDLAEINEAKQASVGGITTTTDTDGLYPVYSLGPQLDGPVASLNYSLIHKYIPLIANAVVIVGTIYCIYVCFRRKQYVWVSLFGVAGGTLLALLLVLPGISYDYNFERLYQQVLLVLAPAFVVAFGLTARFIAARIVMVAASVLAVLVMVSASGLADQALFGASNVNLQNAGTTYDHFYTDDAQYAALQWLGTQPTRPNGIQIDHYGSLALNAYTRIPAEAVRIGVLPSEIRQDAYVFATRTNTEKGMATMLYKGRVYSFNFPVKLVENTKNTVYSSPTSIIYK
jgi:uncharacterized membrane protein